MLSAVPNFAMPVIVKTSGLLFDRIVIWSPTWKSTVVGGVLVDHDVVGALRWPCLRRA